MIKNSQTLSFQPHFGAFILETLTMGMYGESRNAIREYVQNSFDSLRQAVREGLLTPDAMRVDVTLDIAASQLVIRDNGSGLKASSAVDVLVSIGASRKDFRKNAGFRGIGRLAGIVFCDTLTFSTKARSENEITTVEFDAKKLRTLLDPENNHEDAASTLTRCVTAFSSQATDLEDHFFEVRLSGFHQAPKECLDAGALKSFLTQVSPLPYLSNFPFAKKILDYSRDNSKEIEVIRLFLTYANSEPQELFKPYESQYSVKRVQAPLSDVDFVKSDTEKWWGWIGRKKISGAIKDPDTRGIRVRARNIQIDGTDVMRDIFARTYEEGKPRMSYARFAEWYIGEIFIEPGAAVPNARRDGFEEDEHWISLRKELGDKVGEIYGKLAYKISASEQISVPKMTARLAELEASAKRLIIDKTADWELIAPIAEEAKEINRRLTKALTIAEHDESAQIFELSKRLGTIRYDINRLATQGARHADHLAEIAAAKSEAIQMIYKALQESLGPSDWNKVRQIVQQATGEDIE